MSYWDDKAKEHAPENTLTLRDKNQRLLEIEFITQWLPHNRNYVLEVGCGNGYTSINISPYVGVLESIDSSEEMISRAQRESNTNYNNIRYSVQDVTDLKFDNDFFDVVISERCLINLPTWELQKQAMGEINRVLKPGGNFILVEGSKTGLDNLNRMRTDLFLNEIKTAHYNNNFSDSDLIQYISNIMCVIYVKRFGIYDFITRVLHPMMISPNEPDYDAPINMFAQLLTGALPDRADFDDISRLIGIVAVKK